MKPVICALGIVLLLSGCAANSNPNPAPTTSTSVAPAPTPAPSTVRLGDGSCETFLPAARVASVLGATAPLNDEFSQPSKPESGVGGLGCDWFYGEEGEGFGEASASIVPASVGTAAEVSASTSAAPKCATNSDLDTVNSGCTFSGLVNGWWYEAQLFTFVSPAAQSAQVAPFRAQLSTALKAAKAPGAVTVRSPLSCPAADAAIAPASNLGHGSLTVQTDSPDVPPGETSPLALAIKTIGETSCTWTGSDFSFKLTIDPRSALIYQTCAALVGATSSTLTGVKSVVTFAPDERSLELCASDGVSTVELDAGDAVPNDGSGGWNQAALDLAAKIVVPVLAAARS